MFVGYNTNSGDNIYRMWKPDTNIIHNTCDIIWLKMMFNQQKLSTGMVTYVTQFDDQDINEIEVWEKNVNDCDIIGTPNVSDDENENDPQNMRNEKI